MTVIQMHRHELRKVSSAQFINALETGRIDLNKGQDGTRVITEREAYSANLARLEEENARLHVLCAEAAQILEPFAAAASLAGRDYREEIYTTHTLDGKVAVIERRHLEEAKKWREKWGTK